MSNLGLGIVGFLAGSIGGSFIATLVVRWPQGRATNGRSACDGCNARLRWFELVPLASYLIQRGKCRRCDAGIATDHFWIEAVCAIVGGVAFSLATYPDALAGAFFGWMLVAIAALDFKHFWLPDRLTLLLGAMGLVTSFAGLAPALDDRLIGGACGFAALAILSLSYRKLRGRQGMGAGDPKLLGAIGLWLGWQNLPIVLLGASLLGFIYLIVVYFRRQAVTLQTRLPLGALMAVSAFPIWLVNR